MSGMGITLAVLALAAGRETSSKDGPTPQGVAAAHAGSGPDGSREWARSRLNA